MLRLVLGFPGALTNWGARLVEAAAHAGGCGGPVVHANTADQLHGCCDPGGPVEDVIVVSDCPDATLIDHCASREHRAVLIADDLRDAAMLLMARRDFSLAESLRFLSARVGAMWPLFGRATMRPFDRAQIARDPAGAAAGIARHLALDVGRAADRQGALEATLAADAANYVEPGAWERGLDAAAKRLLATVLEPLARLMRGRDCPSLAWPPPLFLLGDRPTQALSAPIDLLGPARLLVYGPYLFLPPGRWRAEAEILLRDGAFRTGLAMDATQLGMRDPLAVLQVRADHDGPHLIRMGFMVERAAEPAEVRIATTEGAIEGSFELRGVGLVRVGG
jgi:hypothetical protein